MNHLREIWGARFIHYMTELQKYMKYVFTGHLAIVFVFTIGAGGYAYSEWLKEVPANFPAALLTAVLIAAILVYSPPVTLLKPADAVYFLPLEVKFGSYLQRSLRWTLFSQLPLPFILYIVTLPVLAATGTGDKQTYIWIALLLFLMKWVFVKSEYAFRHAGNGEMVWLDRMTRFILAGLLIYAGLKGIMLLLIIAGFSIGLYTMFCGKKKSNKPFPYDHFIRLEQNRMMRFYRFANYFTDVPHLKGSVSRRGWLGFLTGQSNFGKPVAQSYLVKRTFIRTDDIFSLWVRLTILSALGAVFIPFPIVIFIFAGALAFASAVQLIHVLRAGDEFRMDMLFPEKEDTRPVAIQKIVRTVQWIQAVVVIIASFFVFGLSITPLLIGAVIVIVSEATIRLTREKEEI
ncbi:ABC transporter permease [Sporosarcina limicola]|uniref:ABC-2 type transport system permease protein n=1 Tax=Sporosarcina limicola TaxID=34101 RepID=A0A927MJB0_9BACL|nr:ABC transporter permease [Sporosarcina limicola]MBE1554901.1 ABC-2 type transport system permease protein [Sporosarcina limicola]